MTGPKPQKLASVVCAIDDNLLDAAFAAGYQAATSSENKKAGGKPPALVSLLVG